MKNKTNSNHSPLPLVKCALKSAFHRMSNSKVDEKGYTCDFRHNLLPRVLPEDFKEELCEGDGNELRGSGGKKPHFQAIHSSSGLAVNCFAPFKQNLADLMLPVGDSFASLHFEKKCPTGLKGTPPNLDILLENGKEVIGIESKFTEFLVKHPSEFADKYKKEWPGAAYYCEEMCRIINQPQLYFHLNAAQLIKHAFGLTNTYNQKNVTLLYLYWEPANPESNCIFAKHREEINEFAERVKGSTPKFEAMSYPELWQLWRKNPNMPTWVQCHLDNLEKRYLVTI